MEVTRSHNDDETNEQTYECSSTAGSPLYDSQIVRVLGHKERDKAKRYRTGLHSNKYQDFRKNTWPRHGFEGKEGKEMEARGREARRGKRKQY